MASQPTIAIIAFDMYGTLVGNDTEQWYAVFSEIATEQGLPLDGHTLYKEWHSREINFRNTRTDMRDPDTSPPFQTYESAWGHAFDETFAALNLNGDATAAARRCVGHLATRAALPDVPDVLRRLATRWPLAVLSNADDDSLRPVITRHGWSFDPIVSSESARSYKPDPRIFAAFCREASVTPERVLYVGDSIYDDMHGAKLAGMQAAWVRRDDATPGRTPPPEGQELLSPDLEVGSLRELEHALFKSPE